MAFRESSDRRDDGVRPSALRLLLGNAETMKSCGFEQCREPADFLAAWIERRCELSADSRREFESYYHSYIREFGPRMRSLYSDQMRELTNVLSEYADRPARVLEVGAGCGTESLWLALQGAEVHGVDLDATRLRVARERETILSRDLSRELSIRWSRESVLAHAGGPYDVVWMEQALHHMEPRPLVLDALVRLLSPGGRLVVAEANALNAPLQANLLMRRGFRTRREYVAEDGTVHPYGNERVMTAVGLARALKRRRMRIESVRHFRLFPNRRLFERFSVLEERLSRNALAPLCTHFNLVARKP